MEEDIYNKDGEIIGSEPIYETFERAVEDVGDGTGEFLWPKQVRHDGKSFGFDIQILAKKRAQYLDKTQFRAQYYNDPNDPDNRPIDYDKFQYFEKEYLTNTAGSWYYRERKLNVFAAVDFAYSLRRKADYTAIVVIGVDYENNVYVLDIDRFRTDKISEYFRHILDLLNKWDFKKLRAEVTAAQAAIVQELKDSYIKPHGLMLKIEEHRPTRHDGSKEERMSAVLEPRYDNLSIYHYKGGNCQLLEEELVTNNPPHDDIKDALASAIGIAVKPSSNAAGRRFNTENIIFSSRFGGIAH
jgi:hypothetical protein